jgi:general L-amino acid transport system permease protein
MPGELHRFAATGGEGKAAWFWHQPRVRSVVYQVLLAAAVALAVWYFISNAKENLQARRIASGFGFLSREGGFEIGETTFLSYNAGDSYLKAITVGFLNTLRVAALAIIFSTVLGVSIGLARLSPNWLITKIAAAYVEVIRNVPLVVQLFFWYAVITESLPAPAEALNPLPGVFLSNRGFACSLYGCLSSRCKSGHGNWLFARVVILDTPQG